MNVNELTSIPIGSFDGLAHLTNLFINTNNIASLDSNLFANLTSMQYLLGFHEVACLRPLCRYAYDNYLTVLPVGALQDMHSLIALFDLTIFMQ